MKFEVTILGSNAAVPAYGRNLTAQVLNVHDQLFLIDCGEGTQIRLLDYKIKLSKIERIFISHLHGDHVFGLIGLLMSYGLNQRDKPLYLYGPAGLESLIQEQLRITQGYLCYPLHFMTTEPDQLELIYQDELMEILSFPLDHKIRCNGYLFREKPGLRRMNKEMIEAHKIPIEQILDIKQGADYLDAQGHRIPNELLTYPPRPARSYAFCTDTAYSEAIIPWIRGVDLLYHEATFTRDLQEHARSTGHSTAEQAAQLASAAGVKHLLIGHFSSRYGDLSPLLEEARAVFPNTSLAIEGRLFYV
jgi:ribonuclease Z